MKNFIKNIISRLGIHLLQAPNVDIFNRKSNRKYPWFSTAIHGVCATMLIITMLGTANASGPLNILTVGANAGNRATQNDVPIYGSPFGGVSHIGSTVTHLNEAGFNALTAAQLAAYDVVLTQWASSNLTDLSSMKVQNYVYNGGALFLDGDFANYNDLSWVGITGAQSFCSGPWTFTASADPILTDTLPASPSLANCHGHFPNFDASVFTVFMTDGVGRNAALAGRYGSGRIILTGPDQDFHASPGTQQYQLLLNELEWTGNASPTANAGIDQSVNEEQIVTLDGSLSNDSDNDPLTLLSYAWSQIGGTTVVLSDVTAIQSTFFAPTVPIGGEVLTFDLTITANDGQSDTDTVDISVVNINHQPVADANDDQSIAENSPVTLDGSDSFDIDSDTITYSWVQIGGTETVSLTGASTAAPSFIAPSYAAGGMPGVVDTLVFELTVDDGFFPDEPAGGYAIGDNVDTMTVEITNLNNDPTAQAGADQTVNENTMVVLNGSASSDPDGDSLTYEWMQIGGTSVILSGDMTATPTLTSPFVSAGGENLTFELTVDDGYLGTSTDVMVIHVQNANDPPNASLAMPSNECLWPPNHKYVGVSILGVSDPEDNATITIDAIWQDEVSNGLGDGDTAIDGIIVGDGTVLLRAERSGTGDGRMYHINFTASDLEGSDSGTIEVCVPHNKKKAVIDGGSLYDSTQ